MLKVPTIHQLRSAGNKVRITHYRHIIDKDGRPDFTRVTKEAKKARQYGSILAKGGSTHLDLTNAAGQSFVAQANCNEKDAFNRRLGIRICLGRLQAQGAFI